MSREYQIASKQESGALKKFLAEQGAVLVEMAELIEHGQVAMEELVDQLGRRALAAVLLLSAEQVAGPAHPGKVGGEVRRHGRQGGVVPLGGQKVRLEKPRLRRKTGGPGAEVEIPAYQAMQSSPGLRERLMTILMRGVSTRDYQEVVPQMAQRCGVSKSAVSREFAQASAEELRTLCERRFDEVDLLVIYIDGKRFGGHQVVGALGVDSEGYKHILGITEGATENAVVVKGLLEDLVERGVKPGRRRLFVIDGSKALRKAIDDVYGTDNPVQRCQVHKLKNVIGYLPKSMQRETAMTMRAAWKLDAKEGLARLREHADFLERSYPKAAASLREGLEETFTVQRLGLPAALGKCLVSTNLMESSLSGVERRTGRVARWRSGDMALRWAAVAALETEKRFRRIMGHRQLWMLKAALDEGDLPAKNSTMDLDSERLAA